MQLIFLSSWVLHIRFFKQGLHLKHDLHGARWVVFEVLIYDPICPFEAACDTCYAFDKQDVQVTLLDWVSMTGECTIDLMNDAMNAFERGQLVVAAVEITTNHGGRPLE